MKPKGTVVWIKAPVNGSSTPRVAFIRPWGSKSSWMVGFFICIVLAVVEPYGVKVKERSWIRANVSVVAPPV